MCSQRRNFEIWSDITDDCVAKDGILISGLTLLTLNPILFHAYYMYFHNQKPKLYTVFHINTLKVISLAYLLNNNFAHNLLSLSLATWSHDTYM